jgi:hypothetical protein
MLEPKLIPPPEIFLPCIDGHVITCIVVDRVPNFLSRGYNNPLNLQAIVQNAQDLTGKKYKYYMIYYRTLYLYTEEDYVARGAVDRPEPIEEVEA